MLRNRTAPVIGEFCVICAAYVEHDNGSVRVPRRLNPVDRVSPGWDWRVTTECRTCGWRILYA